MTDEWQMMETSDQPPKSLWKLTAPPIPDDDGLPVDADVLIVGAGLTGLALARMLTRAGVGVVVVEARGVGDVTTGNTTGKLSLLQGTIVSDLRSHVSADVVDAYIESNRAAMSWLAAEVPDDPAIGVSRDALTFAMTDDGLAAIAREARVLAAAGVDCELLGATAGATLGLPFDVGGALRLPDQRQLQPFALLGRLAAELRSGGTRIVTGCRVTGADVVDDGVAVTTERGTVKCGRMVLATGTPILDRGLFFAKLMPSRSYVAAYRLPPDAPAPRGMFLSSDGDARSLRVDDLPDGSKALVVGGGVYEPGRARSTAPLLGGIHEWTSRNWPGAELITWWAAQDYRMVTRVPFAGPLPRGGGRIYAATGYNKWGMSNAIASALRIAGQLTSEPVAWDETLGRPHLGLASAGDAVRANAAVGGHLIVDWAKLVVDSAPDERPSSRATGRVIRDGSKPVAESTVDGVTTRVSAVCTHLGGIVTWNDAECSWDCPLHGSRFDAAGRVLEGPAVEPLAPHDV